MSNTSRKYCIVGMGETVVGKRPEATTNSLHLEAIKACLDDAGIKNSQVNGLLTNQPLNDCASQLRGKAGSHGGHRSALRHRSRARWRDADCDGAARGDGHRCRHGDHRCLRPCA